MMQENFRRFCEDREMQAIIRWQASAYHPVMRAASAEREAPGGELIRLTHEWFSGTDIDFGGVLSFVLSGSYFPVLQCGSGNGVFCGKDTAIPSDREVLERTAGQIIHWAWQAAAEQRHPQTTNDMNALDYEYEKLETLIGQLVGVRTAVAGTNPLLKAEAKRLESLLLGELLSLDNEVQIRLFLKTNLNRLVRLCNRLYYPGATGHGDAMALLNVMDALRKAVSDMLPEDIVLPELFRDRVIAKFTGRWARMRQALADHGIDPSLLSIVETPLERFADADTTATWAGFRYLRTCMRGLDGLPAEPELDNWSVCERLIALGFNHNRFLAYLTRAIRNKADMLEHGQRQAYLHALRQRVLQVLRLTTMRLERDMPPVTEEIVRWLEAEIAGQNVATHQPPSLKISTTFKVTQLSLWLKLLYDHGIHDEANLDGYAEKIAHCFSTKGQESLSPASIKSKFYGKDRDDIRFLRKLLDAMRDDLGNFE